MTWWFRQKLFVQIAICIGLGIGLGFVMGDRVSVIAPVGDIFLRLLKMLIVPLTFFTLINGVLKMGDLRSLRSVGGRTLGYYLLTSLLAAAIGMGVALVLQPGKEASGVLSESANVETAHYRFIENLIDWIPTNPIQAMASSNMLQVIVFSLITGVTLLALGKRVEGLARLAGEGTHLMIRMTEYVMKCAPYGILALIANMVSTMSTSMLSEVVRFVLSDVVSMALILIIVYPLLLRFIGHLHPVRFYRSVAPAMLVAASTTSSSATLPVSLRIAGKNLGAPESVYGFTLPLGMTINMDGMAASLGVIGVFSANLYGIQITPLLLVQFVFLGLILSIGTAGIKSSGVVMSTVLLQTLNLPLTLIPILAAVWPVIDIGHTTANVTGDLCGTALIASRMDAIDELIRR